ncbi:RNA-directed DNA polymerase, eukaryota [Tanacetum coccineum]
MRWMVIEGDENSKFFHRIINKKRSQLAIRGVLVDGDWIVDPSMVKNEFLKHFANRFAASITSSITFDSQFPNRLSPDQNDDLQRNVSYDEIKRAVWDCGINKSPGPDGFTFEFYRKYWNLMIMMLWLLLLLSFLLGDPISLFLFILIMESMHLSFNNVVNVGLYNAIHIDDSLSLSHLFYVDDVIFVGKWNLSNLSTIVNVLKWFYLASGLKINLHKSKLMGIGIPNDVVASAARSIGCSTLHTPFNYLGVKVGGIMSRLSSWDDVVAKLSSKLSKWKLKTLSIGGRLTLIKSVLSSLSLYYMSSFKVPKGVLRKMESIRRNSFNGVENAEKKMSLICWNKILALIKMELLAEVRKLSNKGIDLLSLVKKKVGNGEATSFWNDVWLGDSPLKQTYPRLYFLELDKHASVASKLRDNSLTISFRSDRWTWRLDSLGVFSVKSAREFIDDSLLPKEDLPTRLNLSLRGLDIPSIIFPLCSIAVESTSHLLFSYQLARQLLLKVARCDDSVAMSFLAVEANAYDFSRLQVPCVFPTSFFEDFRLRLVSEQDRGGGKGILRSFLPCLHHFLPPLSLKDGRSLKLQFWSRFSPPDICMKGAARASVGVILLEDWPLKTSLSSLSLSDNIYLIGCMPSLREFLLMPSRPTVAAAVAAIPSY